MILQRLSTGLIPYDEVFQDEFLKLPIGKPIEVKLKKGGSATDQQRKAIFVWCAKLAKAFNDAGITRGVNIGTFEIESDWDKDSIYRDLWCPMQSALVKTDSIRLLEKEQLDLIYNTINRDVLAPRGVYVAFPSREMQFYESLPERG